jgi:hypothetical protein
VVDYGNVELSRCAGVDARYVGSANGIGSWLVVPLPHGTWAVVRK